MKSKTQGENERLKRDLKSWADFANDIQADIFYYADLLAPDDCFHCEDVSRALQQSANQIVEKLKAEGWIKQDGDDVELKGYIEEIGRAAE